ncbi:CBS domain-containing protein [Amycolatopsis sp. WAC 04169]|uniref:CBS domain-containing protein n=1 Tax=Amycolatopsis sp. WAC 04169 TaxID=2203197 RepID=UPI00351AAD1B
MRARDLMSAPAVMVTPGATVTQPAERLAEKEFTALPVIDEDGSAAARTPLSRQGSTRRTYPRDAHR